jgi:hypothetical protein
MNAGIRREARVRKGGKPAGNILLVDPQGFFLEKNEWIKKGAPSDSIIILRVVKESSSQEILGQD